MHKSGPDAPPAPDGLHVAPGGRLGSGGGDAAGLGAAASTAVPSAPRRVGSVAYDAPTAGQWGVWWRTPWAARVYMVVIMAAAITVTVAGVLSERDRPSAWVKLAGLVVAGIANVELGRLAEGGRVDRQRIHKGLSAWPFAAALLLDAGAAGWVAAAVYAHAWARGIRITTWKWVGSWAIVTLAALAASLTLAAAGGGRLPAAGSGRMLAAVAGALVAFLAVEAGLFAAISRLNSAEDEVYLRAQLASREFYVVEACVLASGAIAAVLARYWPGFVLLAGPAFLLVQRGILHEPLRREARHDPKTGVLNSEAWRAAAGSALAQACRDGRRAAVLLVDLDRFKSVNDTRGHLVGDAVLTAAADALAASLRRCDVAGRFGGDELCALLVCDTYGEALAAGERIRSQIGRMTFADPTLAVTASVGVAVTGRDRGVHDLRGLLATADEALYEAKRSGRDQVCGREAPG